MEELICRILEEIENRTYKTGIEDLNVKKEDYLKALERIESEELLPKNCLADAKNEPHLFAKNAQLTPKGLQFLRSHAKL